MTSVDIGGVDPGYDGGDPDAYGEGGNNFGDGGYRGVAPPGWANAFPGVMGMQLIDWLAQQHWGNGIAGRGSSNDPVEGGANGPNDIFEQIVQALTGNTQPRQPITANPRAGQEGSRRPGNTVGANMRYPNRGRSTLRRGRTGGGDPYMMDRKPGWENPPPDLEKMPRIIDDKMLRIPAPTGSVNQMLGPNASTPPVDLSKMFNNILASTNQAVQDRSGGLNYLLGRGVDRGDFALDDNAATAVNPVLMQGRNQALQSLLNGSRVSDNIFDLSNLGANIGAKQGAQNINVRSRIPSRTRRF